MRFKPGLFAVGSVIFISYGPDHEKLYEVWDIMKSL